MIYSDRVRTEKKQILFFSKRIFFKSNHITSNKKTSYVIWNKDDDEPNQKIDKDFLFCFILDFTNKQKSLCDVCFILSKNSFSNRLNHSQTHTPTMRERKLCFFYCCCWWWYSQFPPSSSSSSLHLTIFFIFVVCCLLLLVWRALDISRSYIHRLLLLLLFAVIVSRRRRSKSSHLMI